MAVYINCNINLHALSERKNQWRIESYFKIFLTGKCKSSYQYSPIGLYLYCSQPIRSPVHSFRKTSKSTDVVKYLHQNSDFSFPSPGLFLIKPCSTCSLFSKKVRCVLDETTALIFRNLDSKYRVRFLADCCNMDGSTLQGLSYISMASNNSLSLPRSIFNSVPCVSIWEGSVNEGECGPQQILQPTENQLNQDESTHVG